MARVTLSEDGRGDIPTGEQSVDDCPVSANDLPVCGRLKTALGSIIARQDHDGSEGTFHDRPKAGSAQQRLPNQVAYRKFNY